MSKEKIYQDLIAFHPGSYIEDIIENLNITQGEFAERLGTSSKTVSKLVNGEEGLSNDIANKLAKLTGVSIKTWLNLQNAYDIKVIEIEDAQNEDERRIVDLVHFSYFKNHGFIEYKERYSKEEKIRELRKLLNISNLALLFGFNNAVSYREMKEFDERSIVNSNIMLEIASNIARNKTDNKYSQKKLEVILPEIKKMTLEDSEIFYPRLKEMLVECGVVLVGLPNLRNASLQGATKRFKNGSVLLLITDRNKDADIFWFSLIHELGHIYHKDFYSDYEDRDLYNQQEDKADKFAHEFLIPDKLYNDFVGDKDFRKEAILNFSKELKIHPGIVVGRLQRDEYIEYYHFRELKVKYSFKFEENKNG